MRIVVVTNYLPPKGGGVEFVTDALARAYVAAGHDTTLVGFDAASRPLAAPYHRSALRGWNGLEQRSVPVPLPGPSSLGALRRVVRSADALHVHGLAYPSSIVALATARPGTPLVVTEHVGFVPYGSSLPDGAQRIALGTGARLARWRGATLVVLNDRVARELSTLAPAATIHKLPNGVDVDRFHPPTDAQREEARRRFDVSGPAVLVVARNAKKKRLDLVTAAAALAPQTTFFIAGRGTELLAAGRNVRLLGEVDQDTLLSLYWATDVLLLPSESEGFPLVILEAMAAGLPVIAGHDEDLARELPAPVRLTARNATAIAASVQALVDDHASRRAVAHASRAAATAFSWKEIADRYLALLQPPARVC